MPTPHSPLRRRFPSIDALGLAVEYFPRYRNFRYRPHSLDVVLLSFIIRGRGRHIMGSHVFEETGASLGITHYGQKHDIVTDREGMEIYNVYVDLENHALPSLPQEFRDLLPEILPLHPHLQNLLNRRVRIGFEDPAPFAELLARMERELRECRPGSEEVVRSCFRILLVECCRRAMDAGIRPELHSTDATTVWLERVRRHLDQSFRERQSLKGLARVAGVSAPHLCRAFKTYTGQNLFEYLLRRRIQAAMYAIRSSDEKILAIALDSGFNDMAYFNRRFKGLVGCTPTQYRLRTAELAG